MVVRQSKHDRINQMLIFDDDPVEDLLRPTLFEPGSQEKIVLLRERWANGVSLHIEGDAVSEYTRQMHAEMLVEQRVWE